MKKTAVVIALFGLLLDRAACRATTARAPRTHPQERPRRELTGLTLPSRRPEGNTEALRGDAGALDNLPPTHNRGVSTFTFGPPR